MTKSHVFVMVDVGGYSGMAKNLTKENGIVQITDEDCKMAVGLGNRPRLLFFLAASV